LVAVGKEKVRRKSKRIGCSRKGEGKPQDIAKLRKHLMGMCTNNEQDQSWKLVNRRKLRL